MSALAYRRIVLLEPAPTGELDNLGRAIQGPDIIHRVQAIRKDGSGTFGFEDRDVLGPEAQRTYSFAERQVNSHITEHWSGIDENDEPFDIENVADISTENPGLMGRMLRIKVARRSADV